MVVNPQQQQQQQQPGPVQTQGQEVEVGLEDLKGLVAGMMDKYKGGYQVAKGLSIRLRGLMMIARGDRAAANITTGGSEATALKKL